MYTTVKSVFDNVRQNWKNSKTKVSRQSEINLSLKSTLSIIIFFVSMFVLYFCRDNCVAIMKQNNRKRLEKKTVLSKITRSELLTKSIKVVDNCDHYYYQHNYRIIIVLVITNTNAITKSCKKISLSSKPISVY